MPTLAETLVLWAEHKLSAMEARAAKAQGRQVAAGQAANLLAGTAALYLDQSTCSPYRVAVTVFSCPLGGYPGYPVCGAEVQVVDGAGAVYWTAYTGFDGYASLVVPDSLGTAWYINVTPVGLPAVTHAPKTPFGGAPDVFIYCYDGGGVCYAPCPAITLAASGFTVADWAGTTASFAALAPINSFASGVSGGVYNGGYGVPHLTTLGAGCPITGSPKVTYYYLVDGSAPWKLYLVAGYVSKYGLGLCDSYPPSNTPTSLALVQRPGGGLSCDQVFGPVSPSSTACDPFALTYDFTSAVASGLLAVEAQYAALGYPGLRAPDPFGTNGKTVTLGGTNA